MASKSLGTLTLDVVAKVGGFTAGMDKSARESEKWRKKVERDLSRVGDVSAKAAKAFIASSIATGAALALIYKNAAERGDATAKIADSIGIATEKLGGLRYAADLAGTSNDQLDKNLVKMTKSIGEMIEGAGAGGDALSKLGLNTRAFFDLTPDQQFSKIADKINDLSTSAEKATTASDIFGRSGVQLLNTLSLGSEGLAAMQARAESLGLTLTRIDLAKMEIANDAMLDASTISAAFGNAIATQLSPLVAGLAKDFTAAAQEAGGFNNVVADGVTKAVSALGLIADSVHVLNVAWETITQAAREYFNVIVKAQSLVPALLADGMDLVGIDPKGLGDIREFADSFDQTTKDMRTKLDDLAMQKYPSELIKNWVADTRAAVDEEAKKIADGATGNGAGLLKRDPTKANEEAEKALKEFGELIRKKDEDLKKSANDTETALRKELVLFGDVSKAETLAFEIENSNLKELSDSRKKGLIDLAKELDVKNDLVKLTESYTSLVSTLRTDEEKLTDEMRGRFAVMDAMKGLSADDRKKTGSRIAEAAFQDAPEYEGLAPEVGGAFGELMKLEDSASELDEWYNTQIERLDKFRQEKSHLNAVWDEQEAKIKQEHEDGLASIEQSRQLLSLQSTEQMFASLTDMAGQFAGEQSGIYKAMFAIQKAAAIAQSLVSIQTGIALAAANPWPANLAAMASVAAATASIIGNIMAVGMAHDGVDSVPKSGTWLLEKGERVTTANTSAKLDKTLSNVQQNMSGNSGQAGGVRIVNAWDTSMIGDYMGGAAGERVIMNAVKRNSKTIRTMAG